MSWITDLSANRFNNTYFRDAHGKGFAVDMSGDLVVRGNIGIGGNTQWTIQSDSDLQFYYDDNLKAHLSPNDNVGALDFTGQHRCVC